MSSKHTTRNDPATPSGPPAHAKPLDEKPGDKREAAEPAEVLGRHRNSGQKDHKGAR